MERRRRRQRRSGWQANGSNVRVSRACDR
jgi:hypothetical protein